MEPCTNMAALAAMYQTKSSTFEAWNNDYQLVLAANPQRFYVEFQFAGGVVSDVFLIPGPLPIGLLWHTLFFAKREYKYYDCPSIVTGEFYCRSQMPAVLVITEVLYVGNS